jgi:N-acetylglucosamine malate deacetylase 1
MNPYHHFVSEYVRLAREGRTYPLGAFPKPPQPLPAPDAPKVLIFSPHPDDEVIIGGVALRLSRESGGNVINVAVTQGSNPARQAGRLQELRACCECIGFNLLQTAPTGLEGINLKTREQDPARWQRSVNVVADILARHQPRAILFPHALDWNSTHVGTHWLVMDALRMLPADFACHTVETEFWGQNPSPNLMVELSAEHLADLVTALTCHVEEVKRNPYHLSLPAWMLDNVRRGAELVGGQGGASPDFTFGTLYRLRRWRRGGMEACYSGGKNLPLSQRAEVLFI